MEDPGIRRLWIEFLGKRLVELGEVIADAVHKVNPDIEVGLMIPCIHPLTVMGHTITNVLEAFRGRRRPLVRPPIGPYRDWNRRDIIPGLFYIEYAGHLLGDKPEYTVEIESFPYTRFSKSMAIVRFHIIQALLNRMDNFAISPALLHKYIFSRDRPLRRSFN